VLSNDGDELGCGSGETDGSSSARDALVGGPISLPGASAGGGSALATVIAGHISLRARWSVYGPALSMFLCMTCNLFMQSGSGAKSVYVIRFCLILHQFCSGNGASVAGLF
jgi:hypothetical protein